MADAHEFDVVVIGAGPAGEIVAGRVAEVGEEGEGVAGREQVAVAVGDEETDGVLGVVRHREAAHLEVAEAEGAAGLEELPVDPVLEGRLQGLRGGAVGEDADVRVAGQSAEGGAVPLYGQLLSASVVCALPVVVLYLFFQRYLVGGLTSGGVKG